MSARWSESRAAEWLHGPLADEIYNGAVYYIKCLGTLPGSQWLDGRTLEGTVGLAKSTAPPYTGTRWRAQKLPNGAWAFRCLGDEPGNRWLDGRTASGTVGLAPDPDSEFTGTRWQVVPVSKAAFALKCLGHVEGKRFLDGATATASASLAPHASYPYTGTHWELRQERWWVGCNFIPSTAVNQLEMWQADTFDTNTIDRELGWAQDLGFNAVRVFLHDLLWSDPDGFKDRIRTYLDKAAGRGIGTLFVFFDDCWFSDPKLGGQDLPIPNAHNSRWVQSPGDGVVADTSMWPRLESYLKGILEEFGDDERVIGWDLYNEPGGGFGHEAKPCPRAPTTLPLLEQVFAWAQAVDPQQPLTAGAFSNEGSCEQLRNFQLANSDVISFHRYANPAGPPPNVISEIHELRSSRRPLLCTEYMARAIVNSRFENHLELFKERGVGCFNWGLVAGKTQTFVPWGSARRSRWFHDIFHTWGTPYSEAEVAIVKCLTDHVPSGTGIQHNAIYRFKCLGDAENPKGLWLDGRTVTGEVGLVTNLGLSGTWWRVIEIREGVFALECMGDVEGNRWLDGRTVERTVGLAPEASRSYTGTRWQLCNVGGGVYVFRCLGEIEGSRLLDGRTTDGTVGLARYADPWITGIQWQAEKA